MSTLLLRLAAPLQSWGEQAKFDRRTTERAPTKSGVTGLIAAALGRRRNDSIDDIAALRFGIRTDREGMLLRDFHTAKSERSAYVTNRYYLADAVFLAGLEGDDAMLNLINAALASPAFPLFLGRRSCPPAGRVSLGVRKDATLEEALENEPLLVPLNATDGGSLARLRIIIETAHHTEQTYYIRDLPVSFNQEHRRFGFRNVCEYTKPRFSSMPTQAPTEHDPMAEPEV